MFNNTGQRQRSTMFPELNPYNEDNLFKDILLCIS